MNDVQYVTRYLFSLKVHMLQAIVSQFTCLQPHFYIKQKMKI